MHPLVTLLEKLDALMRRLPREHSAPATFVRHFEDAARIARAATLLPSLPGYRTVRDLADEMLAERQIAEIPTAAHASFAPTNDDRWRAVREAHDAIAPMFWGQRLSVEEACAEIRRWLDSELRP